MTAPWRRSSAMRCMCCSARRANSPTTPRALLRARSALDEFAQAFANAGGRRRRTRCHPHRRARRPGNRGQFRRRPFLRLHRLRRHHQHRGPAGNRQQATRHAHLRKRECREARRRFSRSAGWRSRIARQDRGATHLRAAPRAQYEDPATAAISKPLPSSKQMIQCVAAFAAHVGRCPDDQLASFHLKRLLNGATGTRIAMD